MFLPLRLYQLNEAFLTPKRPVHLSAAVFINWDLSTLTEEADFSHYIEDEDTEFVEPDDNYSVFDSKGFLRLQELF